MSGTVGPQCQFKTDVRHRWGLIEGETWQCPHPSFEQNDLCIFHLPVSDKNDKLVSENLIQLVNGEIDWLDFYENPKRRKQFIEADFGELDLSYQVLAPQDNYPIDLRGSTFLSIDLCNSIVENSITFEDSEVMGTTHLWPTHFKGETIFARVVFNGQFSMTGSTFEDELWFTDAEFHGPHNLFGTGVDATDARVVWCGRTSFFDEADFSNGKFPSITFMGARFEAPISFENATIRSLGLSGSSFYESVSAKGAEIIESINLTEPSETQPVDHFMDSYRDPDDPEGPIFESSSNFESLKIGDEFHIESADFRGDVSLNSVDVENKIRIENCHFSADVSVRSANLGGDAIFRDNLHDEDVDMAESTVENLLFKSRDNDDKTLVDLSDCVIQNGELDSSEFVYNLEGATIGDVRLYPSEDHNLIDRYRILMTQFEDFNFPRYSEYFQTKKWDIVSTNHFSDDEVDAEDLEETYLKAKNGALQVGDTKASSEFHYKELFHRGRSHWKNKRRPSRFRSWVFNGLYFLSSGYGERPYRVILSFSLFAGVIWFLSNNPLTYLVLILPFFSALFVFTLTRTLGD